MHRSVISPIPIFFLSTLLILFFYLSMSPSGTIPAPAPSPAGDHHFKYTVQKGYFMQSEDSTNDQEFDFKTSNFGLINRDYPTDEKDDKASQWTRFARYIRHVNTTLQDGSSIKVLFLGRHGQGWHNVAETKYGTKAWDCYWSALNGADGLTWFDAHLTPLGEQQALSAHTLWSQQLPHGLPPPQSFYVSPLTRAIQTADLTFSSLPLTYSPVVRELVREALGVHTCDRRSRRSEIQAAFPHLVFPEEFSEEDLLWEKDYREPRSARRYRLARFLDDVWGSDGNVWVSMTAHSGAIASVLEVLGHREFALETGGVIPVVVRAERVGGKREVPEKEPSDAPPMCDGPPEA